ncbi:MAG: chromate resistance protein [Bacillota bacterium]|nr:chromate resistance protein [Bacillota bacterium]
MRWVTWENVGIDRLGCAWLISRFIDKDAEFVFVPYGSAFPEGAEPFDVPGVRLTHHRGRCTFMTCLQEYSLTDPTVVRIGDIINGADVPGDLFSSPESPGLEAVCRAIRRASRDDAEAIRHAMVVFEGLYQLFSDESRSNTRSNKAQ